MKSCATFFYLYLFISFFFYSLVYTFYLPRQEGDLTCDIIERACKGNSIFCSSPSTRNGKGKFILDCSKNEDKKTICVENIILGAQCVDPNGEFF